MGWTPIASHGLTLPLATFLPAHWIKEPFIVFRKCLGLLRSGYIPYARRVRASEESILLSSPSSFLEASSATTMGFEGKFLAFYDMLYFQITEKLWYPEQLVLDFVLVIDFSFFVLAFSFIFLFLFQSYETCKRLALCD